MIIAQLQAYLWDIVRTSTCMEKIKDHVSERVLEARQNDYALNRNATGFYACKWAKSQPLT